MGTLWVEIISFFCRKMNIWKQSRKAFTSPVNWNFYNKWLWESSLSVQCLGFGIFTAVDLIWSLETEIPQAAWHGQINKCFLKWYECSFNSIDDLEQALKTEIFSIDINVLSWCWLRNIPRADIVNIQNSSL